jgi:LacI family transcriptional regulator
LVTLRQVATRAGVSVKTVSRIVRDDPLVRSETRAAVQAILRDMNYVPDEAARLMRGGASNIIGLLTDVVATTPYSGDIVRGLQSRLKAKGKTLLIANTEGDAQLEREYWRMFRAHKAAGAVYATMYHRALDPGRPDFNRAIVLANCFPAHGGHACVLPDDENGGFLQARHLLRLGHRRIGVISLNPIIVAANLRAAGMRRAFAEAGVTFDAALETPGFAGSLNQETLIAYEAALAMLRQPRRPTAIICGNDKVALQVFAAATQCGLSIPLDLSVMGYDDLTVIAETLRPRLTTVALPYFEMGREAADLIAEAAARGEGWAPRLLVPCPLIERDSCRALV